ncbi:MAG: hypothetical protein A3B96_02420 [Candidatus Spechtbacteria bacterium RIFCSPHIGHO2_02_FULL_43_15b]|nr:MAG: hypothetical protein A3B96_02420 [Candidatus Spechtbacteria bacterium RIFCSPHIGHO2_02_FULL_43_15b]
MSHSTVIKLFSVAGILGFSLIFLRLGIGEEFLRNFYEKPLADDDLSATEEDARSLNSAKLADPPKIVKAVYLSSESAANEEKIVYAINLANETAINAVVIDIKDFSGYIFYDTKVYDAEKYFAEKAVIKDISSLIARFHRENIYVIARAVVFQDPRLAVVRPDIAVHSAAKLAAFPNEKYSAKTLWRDNSGLAWVDPASKDVWDYNISIMKDAFSRGFDEINLDYIRFPSDGALSDMQFTVSSAKTQKHKTILEFFSYLNVSLPDEKISADLFGYTTTNKDDLGIGQLIEDGFGNFDYISPMVYPSHYSIGFLGYQSPASYPYAVVNFSMGKAAERLDAYKTANNLERETKFRPWLQDFTIRGVYYGEDKVRAQIQATENALGENYAGYMLWNSRNIYTKEAIY